MQIRSLLVVVPVLLLAACANPAGDDPDVALDETLSPSLLLDGTSLSGDIGMVCPPPGVDVTHALYLGDFWYAEGAAKVENPCDSVLLEVTNSLGADQLVFKSTLVGWSPQVDNQADCESSKISAFVTGEVNGKWQRISTLIEYGTWGGSYCAFPKFAQGTTMNIPGGQIVDSPYSRVRIATRAVFNTPLGARAGTIRMQPFWLK